VIAIPTPVRYADLCAYRSKVHIEAQRAHEDSQTSGGRTRQSGGGQPALDPAAEEAIINKLNQQVKLNDNIKHRLYYC